MQNIPTFITGDELLDHAFRIAMGDFLGNVVFYQGGLNQTPVPAIIAGLDYVTPWTRDSAFNTWFAGGLLTPQYGKNTLLSVLTKDDKSGQVRIGGEYWDAIIWTWGAWSYYLYTGDREFLTLSLQATLNSLDYFENTEFDPADGLFRGGACFQDGIAAYPDKFVAKSFGSGILSCLAERPDCLAAKGVGLPMKALSTNCLYLMAYQTAIAMQKELGQTPDISLSQKAADLKTAINQNFYNPDTQTYRYLLDADDPEPTRQEGLGSAFALIAGVAQGDVAKQVISNQILTPNGIPCVWPTYPRYTLNSGEYGRHSGTIWPQVNATWAYALALNGQKPAAYKEYRLLAAKAVRDGSFFELYHPETGNPYGGLQEREELHAIGDWASCRRQTWCATGFINMALTVVCGLRFGVDGICFDPYLPTAIPQVRLQGLPYRQMQLDVTVQHGATASLTINDQAADFLPNTLTGAVKAVVTVAD